MKMTHYVGTKILMAIAMTRQAYNDYRGWQLPADENGADEGYLVEYLDGGKPNHPDHAGYISWSPKTVFEGSYVPVGDIGEMQPHQQRVVAEKAALDDKVGKLETFFNSDTFNGLSSDEIMLFWAQKTAMQEYARILVKRIAAF